MSIIINNLSYIHPDGVKLFQNVSFAVEKGNKVNLIGNNGTGKSTLLKIIAGEIIPTGGEIVSSEDIYYVPQHFGQFDEMTVSEALRIDKKIKALQSILQGDASEENFNLLNDDWNIEERVAAAFATWNLPNVPLDQKMRTLSGGEKTKIFLSGIEIHSPSAILMDEPSNHLDRQCRKQLYNFIQSTPLAVIVVSHDRTLLNLLDTTFELTPNGIYQYGGNYEFYKVQKAEKINALVEQLNNKEKDMRKAKKIAQEAMERKERENSHGKKRKIKENALPALMDKLQGKAEQSTARLKETHNEKMGAIASDIGQIKSQIPPSKSLKLDFENASLHTGKILVTAQDINFGYTSQMLWENPLNFQIKSGARFLIKGNNGKGKTTLLKLITGKLEPTQGTIKRADFNHIFIDQEYSIIDENLTVYEQAEQYNKRNLYEHEIRLLLNRYLLPPSVWDKKCNVLSGGEKMKLVFCCVAISNNAPDMFIMDEPTNNIDIEGLEMIISALKDYKGTIILISHDEYFANDIGINNEIKL